METYLSTVACKTDATNIYMEYTMLHVTKFHDKRYNSLRHVTKSHDILRYLLCIRRIITFSTYL